MSAHDDKRKAAPADAPDNSHVPADVLAHAPRGPRPSLKALADEARRIDAEDDDFADPFTLDGAGSGDGAPAAGNGDDLPGGDVRRGPRARRNASVPRALMDAALDAALPRDVRRRIMRGDPVAVVVAVPGPDWVWPVAKGLMPLSRDSFFVTRDGSKRREHVPTEGNDEVANALRRGNPVLGVSQAPDALLPATLLAAADAVVTVQTPDGPTLRRVLRRAGFRCVPRDLPFAPCAGLSFDDVLSAMRRGATGRDVLAALARMAARKAGTGGHADDGVPPLPALPGFSGPARDWGMALIDAFDEWRLHRRAWRDVPSASVLAGGPGTGKTYFARSLAKALGVPLIATSVGDWFVGEGNLGDVLRGIQDVWDRAMAARPVCLLVDEIDAVPNRESISSSRNRDWWLPIIAKILTLTDGAQTRRDGLILLGCTNYGARLDPALVRKGRFDAVIPVGLPGPSDLSEVLSFHLGGTPPPADLLPVVSMAVGASAADAEAWARGARNRARAARRPVSVADVLAVVAPPDTRPPDAVRRVAVHEAAHAVVGRAVGRAVTSVSIVEAGSTGGSTWTTGEADYAATPDAIDRAATYMLAGRAGEEVLLGSPSSGAEGDLASATALLAAAHGSVGLGAWLTHRAPSAEAAALLVVDTVLRDVVEAHLAALYADALALVRTHRDAIERVADALVARRFLTGDDVAALAGGNAAGGAP